MALLLRIIKWCALALTAGSTLLTTGVGIGTSTPDPPIRRQRSRRVTRRYLGHRE
ncbi:hypothetical protein BDQ12DRAFT_690099 [Crucibulum laeve]|uniref:Uncharacterized protein n=1 Tax=Crucibulum laeve TaxID=68775 RepID=A0A5C3LN69_9AGAR|nr:hypothetical protein BDQ12DRAFT_690099 [Crucibulum laeve]